MKTIKIQVLIALLCLGIASCKKDENQVAPNGPPTSQLSMKEMLEAYAEPVQTFTVSASFSSAIETEDGAIITFPPGAFGDAQGNPVVGNVDVMVTEIYSKSEMMLSNKPTTSGGQFLSSGGEMKIEASQNGTELQLIEQATVQVRVDNTSLLPDENMGFFTGEENEDGSVEWTMEQETVQTSFLDSLITGSCSHSSGQISLLTGQNITITYSSGNEPISDQFMSVYVTCDPVLPTITLEEGVVWDYTATGDCPVIIDLWDLSDDGWNGAFLTIDIDGIQETITIDSETCIEAPFSWYYTIDLVHLGWINCDYFPGMGLDLSTMSGELPEDYECFTTVTYVVLSGYNSVMNTACSQNVVTTQQMPVGEEVTICSLANIDGTFYSSFSTLLVEEDGSFDFDFEETSIEQFEQTVNGL